MAQSCFLEGVDHHTPKYRAGRWLEHWTTRQAQVLVFRQVVLWAGVEAIRVLLMTVVTPFLKPPLPGRGCARI